MSNNTLHVCWLVDAWKASRDKYIEAWEYAGWNVCLWHAGNLTCCFPSVAELRDVRELVRESPVAYAFDYELRHRSHAAATDLARFAVLHELGGGYADLDVLPRNARCSPHDPLFGMPQGAGDEIPAFQRGRGALRSEQLEIRFISAPARHPLLARVLQAQALQEMRFIVQGGYLGGVGVIVERTGPILVSQVVREYAQEHGRTFGSFLLTNATFDHTPENLREHMTERYAEILAAARG